MMWVEGRGNTGIGTLSCSHSRVHGIFSPANNKWRKREIFSDFWGNTVYSDHVEHVGRWLDCNLAQIRCWGKVT